MANVEVKDVEEFVEVKQIKKFIVKKYILEMSREEAQFLIDLLGHVGGSPYTSRRKYSASIFDALEKTQSLSFPSGAQDIKPCHGQIVVEDTWLLEEKK